MLYQNIAKAKAIEHQNRERLLKVNPKLNDKSGIYFLLREDENGFKFAYIGQAKSLLQRLSSHMAGYQQHIDLSLRKHKLYDPEKNPYGWRVEFLNFPESWLDEKEKYFIKLYADRGYQLRNVSLGGQEKTEPPETLESESYLKGTERAYSRAKRILPRNYHISLKSTLKSA